MIICKAGLQTIIALAIVSLLSACDGLNQNPAADYVTRLRNVLDVSAPAPAAKSSIDYPAPRELKVEQRAHELSIREFLSLRECDLHKIIAARNSLIGKVALPSQRLFSDLAILNAGPDCLAYLNESKQLDLSDKLNTFLTTKRAALPAALWHALLGEDENAKFWSVGARVDDYPNNLAHESVPDIKALIDFADRALHGDYDAHDTTVIEQHLGAFRNGDGGRLLREYIQLSSTLGQANFIIEQRLKRPMCFNQQATTDARYFQNVVNNQFISKVQSYALALERRYRQLMPNYLILETMLLTAAPANYRLWVDRRQALIAKGRAATKVHAEFIQRLFKQCGLTPGNPPR